MSAIILFEEKQVRRAWNSDEEKWYFAVVDVLAILTDSTNPQVYWRVLKKRLADEGNQTVTKCNALKMTAADGRQRVTDVADTEQLLRLIQSVPSPKAEPFKLWLARVGYERLEEIENPELAAKRMRVIYEQKGYSEEWIEKRLRGIAVRDELTDEWKKRGVKEQKEFAILTAEISNATFGMLVAWAACPCMTMTGQRTHPLHLKSCIQNKNLFSGVGQPLTG
jgi:DNA-damage-inducible protein D